MPTPTPELGLQKALDPDDTADYLVTSLANSLTTVDALFNNVSGHTHSGAHQGGPVAVTPPSASLTNDQLGPDVARANLLTNGGFEIWQRGAGPFTTSTAFSADRWSIYTTGSDTLSLSRDTTNFDASGGGACAACTFVLSGGAGVTNLNQAVVPGDLGTAIRQCTVSLSIRVRTATANAVRIGLNNGSVWSYSSYHTGSGTYQTLTVTATMSSTVSYSVAVFFAASCTAYLDNACLVVGSQPANYVPLHPADELARCLRYYEILGDTTGVMMHAGNPGAGVTYYTTFSYKARKPVTPTVTKVGTWGVSNSSQASPDVLGLDQFRMAAIASAAGYAYNNNGAGQYVTVEANP